LLNVHFRTVLTALIISTALGGCVANATPPVSTITTSGGSQKSAAPDTAATVSDEKNRNLPSFVMTNDPPPDVIYRRGSRDTVLANKDTSTAVKLPSFDTQHVETLVTRKAADLSRDLKQLERETDNYKDRLQSLQSKSDSGASEYYTLVASINTELQSGTTPGNPVLVERWNVAQDKLNELAQSAGYLNELATDLSSQASKAGFLLESVRATFGLSGAVQEDHKKLTVIEDEVNNNIVAINRLSTAVNDEINRRTTYLRAERSNMQTLSLGITNGEMYGQSMTNSLYKKATEDGRALFKPEAGSAVAAPSSRRPLVIIRFDRPNINYDQAIYTAVSQSLEKYPAAKFDLVAVSPSEGSPAQISLLSTEARKNGEAVLRSLSQMGLPLERVQLNAASSKDVVNSEVHLYIQ
jgi:hypothetical protein